jgi:amicyanin
LVIVESFHVAGLMRTVRGASDEKTQGQLLKFRSRRNFFRETQPEKYARHREFYHPAVSLLCKAARTRRLILTVRDPRHFVANAEILLRLDRSRAQGVLGALRLTVLFTALAAAPCLAEDAANAGAGPVATVSMDHNTFIPGEITVVPGTTVTWTNSEAMPHTVVDQNKAFRSKTLVKDASFSFTFTTAGDYEYLCSIHPFMKGKVIVKPAG